jgi:hypothetical protein
MIQLCAACGLILLASAGRAQEQIPADSAAADSTSRPAPMSPAPASPPASVFKPDTSGFLVGDVADTIDYELHKYQNPTLALFKSMVVPGWGQAGNRQYIKAAIFAGLQTWFVSSAIRHGQDASDARRDWENAATVTERNLLYDIYDGKRDDRNRYIWFAGITAFVAMFDAFVDAHLSGSPQRSREESVTVDVAPRIEGGAEARLTIRF